MVTVLGAGSVGLAIAAQLAAAGRSVRVVARRPEAARALAGGLVVEDPIAGGERVVVVSAYPDLAALPTPIGDGPVFVCTRAPDTPDAARALERHAPRALAVAVQNDLTGGEALARSLPRVVAAVWRLTCTRTADACVRFHGAGRIVLGAEPGCDTARAAAALAAELAAAGLDAACSERIREDQWLKLCINLMSAPNALVRQADHETEAFVETKARLLEEARDALAAAGIVAASCDGRDRGLDAEIAQQRRALPSGTSARKVALYNHVWTGLREGRALEAPDYHRRILDLARAHGVPAETNRHVLAALERAEREKLGPECLGAADLLPAGASVAFGAGAR